MSSLHDLNGYFHSVRPVERLVRLGITNYTVQAFIIIPTLSWFSGRPVYYGHRTTSQNFQLPYIFWKVDLYLCITVTLYIPDTLPFPKWPLYTQVDYTNFQIALIPLLSSFIGGFGYIYIFSMIYKTGNVRETTNFVEPAKLFNQGYQ